MTDIAAPKTSTAETPIWSSRTAAAVAVLAAVIVIGDIVLWSHEPGVSAFVFFVALIFGVLALHPSKLARGRTVVLFVVALLSAAPFIETLSPWAFLTAQGGLAMLALGISDKQPKIEDWGSVFTRFGVLAPVRLVADAFRVATEGSERKRSGHVPRALVAWIVPLGFALVFVLLFTAANPLIESAMRAIRLDRLLELLQPARIILWGLIATFAWPFLVPRLLNWVPLPQMQGPMQPRAEGLFFGRAAILNSLVLFNLIFATQTVMDLLYLWGGVRLPEGLTNAEYAHRGAYPLIVTAILAGAFVLAAMRRNGPGQTSPLIRTLVYVWVAQNVWLVISSILRLKLYVEEYHHSEMRVAAGIWMVLVAIGLILIVAKIALGRTNKWLVMSNMAVLSVTLWGVALVDIRSFIAHYNVQHSYEVTGHGVPLDLYYMSDLGPAAIPALDDYLTTAKFAGDEGRTMFSILRNELTARVIHARSAPSDVHAFAQDWRGWTWREDRLINYLLVHPFAPGASGTIE
jgi:hypothetical protein